MKKITLNETDLMKIVKQGLNEQKKRQFDEDEIDFLHWIFERELKPPFRKGEKGVYNLYPYYNRDGDYIGWLNTKHNIFEIKDSFYDDIDDKVCQAFGFSRSTWDWWSVINPHLKSWIEAKLSIEINTLDATRI